MVVIIQIPIICIANDRSAQKMKPLTNVTFDLKFRKYGFLSFFRRGLPYANTGHDRPDAAAIRSRMLTIAFKSVSYTVLNQ